jgi:uncharacterized protein YcbK (DUF882 family)
MLQMHTRRKFLRTGMALAAAGVASPALAGKAGLSESARRVSLDNIHTGEKLSVDYWVNGDYIPDALHAVNKVLRDFRNGQVHEINPKLLDLLALLHREVESTSPFSIISGYRSPATNGALHARSSGVATRSLHMEGMAVDMRLNDRALGSVHKAALRLKAGGVGLYPVSNFVHVDVGRVRTWSGA